MAGAIIHTGGRQPVIATGTGLNSTNQPIRPAKSLKYKGTRKFIAGKSK